MKADKKFSIFLKRIVDVLGSVSGIIFLSIFFYLPITLAIKLDSDGPVFVSLKRISRGRKIKVYKFRTMFNKSMPLKVILASLNERDGPFFKVKEDPRITPVGKVLRRFRLDEVPQLFNVLKGELSLVGPRPHEPQEVFFYPEKYRFLLERKGGLTGLAQVSGASSLPFLKELKYDKAYLDNWSLRLDFLILFKTFFLIFDGKNSI